MSTVCSTDAATMDSPSDPPARAKRKRSPRPRVLVDGRTKLARRVHQLVREYQAAVGIERAIAPGMPEAIRRAAELSTLTKQARVRALRGELVDLSELTRLEGAADRAVRALRIDPGKAPAGPSLAERITQRVAERVAAPAGAPGSNHQAESGERAGGAPTGDTA
jgi:hypothetical protein